MSEATDYDVVLLIEQALTTADAAQVRSLHEALEEPVTYHLLLPVDEAAARVDAHLGSMTGSDLLATPGLAYPDVDLGAVEDAATEAGRADLQASVEALRAAGATVGTAQLVGGQPIDELAARVEQVDARECLVLTRPHVVAELFRLDWASQARRKLGLPVLHLLEHQTFDEQAAGPDGISGA